MLDQLIIGNVHSYYDFGASVAERKNNKPKKKSIKASVPYSNKVYDFSAIDGEIYWEERELEYVFEIEAGSAEELERKKQPFISWIMGVMNEELHDPFIQDYHFLATYSEMSEDDSQIEKSVITVKFTAYPYMISNLKKTYTFPLTETASAVAVYNNSSHRIVPTITATVACSITTGGSTFSFSTGVIESEKIMLAVGRNSMEIKTLGGSGMLKIEFYEEVF